MHSIYDKTFRGQRYVFMQMFRNTCHCTDGLHKTCRQDMFRQTHREHVDVTSPWLRLLAVAYDATKAPLQHLWAIRCPGALGAQLHHQCLRGCGVATRCGHDKCPAGLLLTRSSSFWTHASCVNQSYTVFIELLMLCIFCRQHWCMLMRAMVQHR